MAMNNQQKWLIHKGDDAKKRHITTLSECINGDKIVCVSIGEYQGRHTVEVYRDNENGTRTIYPLYVNLRTEDLEVDYCNYGGDWFDEFCTTSLYMNATTVWAKVYNHLMCGVPWDECTGKVPQSKNIYY